MRFVQKKVLLSSTPGKDFGLTEKNNKWNILRQKVVWVKNKQKNCFNSTKFTIKAQLKQWRRNNSVSILTLRRVSWCYCETVVALAEILLFCSAADSEVCENDFQSARGCVFPVTRSVRCGRDARNVGHSGIQQVTITARHTSPIPNGRS